MLWDMHLCVFDVRLSFENRVPKLIFCLKMKNKNPLLRTTAQVTIRLVLGPQSIPVILKSCCSRTSISSHSLLFLLKM